MNKYLKILDYKFYKKEFILFDIDITIKIFFNDKMCNLTKLFNEEKIRCEMLYISNLESDEYFFYDKTYLSSFITNRLSLNIISHMLPNIIDNKYLVYNENIIKKYISDKNIHMGNITYSITYDLNKKISYKISNKNIIIKTPSIIQISIVDNNFRKLKINNIINN